MRVDLATLENIYFYVMQLKFCHIVNVNVFFYVISSVADPDPVFLRHQDPDPGKTGSGSFIHKKTPVIIIFSLYKII